MALGVQTISLFDKRQIAFMLTKIMSQSLHVRQTAAIGCQELLLAQLQKLRRDGQRGDLEWAAEAVEVCIRLQTHMQTILGWRDADGFHEAHMPSCGEHLDGSLEIIELCQSITDSLLLAKTHATSLRGVATALVVPRPLLLPQMARARSALALVLANGTHVEAMQTPSSARNAIWPRVRKLMCALKRKPKLESYPDDEPWLDGMMKSTMSTTLVMCRLVSGSISAKKRRLPSPCGVVLAQLCSTCVVAASFKQPLFTELSDLQASAGQLGVALDQSIMSMSGEKLSCPEGYGRESLESEKLGPENAHVRESAELLKRSIVSVEAAIAPLETKMDKLFKEWIKCRMVLLDTFSFL